MYRIKIYTQEGEVLVYIFCIYENIYVVYISIYIHNIRVSYKNIYTGGGGFGVYTAYIFSYDFIRYFHTMKIYTQEGEVLVTLVPSLPRHRTLQVTDCLEVSHSASLYMCVLCVQGRSLSLFRSLASERARSLSLARPPARACSRCVCVCVCACPRTYCLDHTCPHEQTLCTNSH